MTAWASAPTSVPIEIPPGVHDGAELTVPGQGHAGRRGGTPGDLRLVVRVAPHPFFRREGDDVVIDVPLALHEAALGARIQVPSPDGPVSVRVPPGTQSGQRFRVREKGAVQRHGRRSDLLVDVRLVLPRVLDERSKELLREFGRLQTDDVRAHFTSPRLRERTHAMTAPRAGKALYTISAVATRYDIHPQTLRLYEREGLLAPSRTEGNTRMFSDADCERLETILSLTRDLGVNLAGVEIILNMRAKMEQMQHEVNEFMEYVKGELARGLGEWEQRLNTAMVKSSPAPLARSAPRDE